jgi:hypothetical protein
VRSFITQKKLQLSLRCHVDSHLPGTYFSFYGSTQHKAQMNNSTALLSYPRATWAVVGIFSIMFRHVIPPYCLRCCHHKTQLAPHTSFIQAGFQTYTMSHERTSKPAGSGQIQLQLLGGRYDVVSTAARYGPDGPWFEPRWGLDFLYPSRPASCIIGTGFLSRG